MDSKKSLTGNVFDVQGLSVHDGPGCRTVFFLKGCSLKCSWCANPEGINPGVEQMFNIDKCIRDGNCLSACPYGAITHRNGNLNINRKTCKSCPSFECVNTCYTGALKKSSYVISVDRIVDIIKRDRKFWGNEGGITLSGGEPFCQHEFAHEILRRCYDSYIHTAVETCGNVKWQHIEKCLPYLDWIYFDLKNMDNDKHRRETTCHNTLILETAVRLSKEFKGRLVFRTPIIPDFNDSEQHLIQLSEFIRSTGKNEINILPLHNLGRGKYGLLINGEFTPKFTKIPSEREMQRAASIISSKKINCYIGSDTPF